MYMYIHIYVYIYIYICTYCVKTSQNVLFSNVFSGYKNRTLAQNGRRNSVQLGFLKIRKIRLRKFWIIHNVFIMITSKLEIISKFKSPKILSTDTKNLGVFAILFCYKIYSKFRSKLPGCSWNFFLIFMNWSFHVRVLFQYCFFHKYFVAASLGNVSSLV